MPSLIRSLRASARTVLLLVAALLCLAVPAAASADDVRSAKVLVVGDSLAVGLKPFLADDLQQDVAWNARSGRTTPQGLLALRSALPVVQPHTVVLSLGTNDGSDPARFESRMQRALAAIPAQVCVVWVTLYRPARKGPYPALNRVLRYQARRDARLTLVNWDWAVARGAVTLPDGLHPDAAGFRLRSRLIADAVNQRCSTTVPSAAAT